MSNVTTILTLAQLQAHDPHGGRGPNRGKRYLCPFTACAHHQNPRKHRHLSLNTETGAWHCWSCGAAGKIRDESERKLSVHQARAYRRARAIATITGRPPIPQVVKETSRQGVKVGLHREVDIEAILQHVKLIDGTPALVYLRQRGICLTVDELRGIAGFANAWLGSPAVVFPIRNTKGMLVGAQGRFLNPNADPKTKTQGLVSYGVFATRDALKSDVVAIVEAPIDALSLAQLELPAIALCGCSVGAQRGAMLRTALAKKTILLATDRDDAGERAAAELQRELTIATKFQRLEIPEGEGCKDVNAWLLADRAGLAGAVRRFIDDASNQLRHVSEVIAEFQYDEYGLEVGELDAMLATFRAELQSIPRR